MPLGQLNTAIASVALSVIIVISNCAYSQAPSTTETKKARPSLSLPAFLSHVEQQWSTIRPLVSRNSVVCQKMVNRHWQVDFKTLGSSNTVSLTGGGWFVGLPRVSADGRTFYFVANPSDGNIRHVIALPLDSKPHILTTLPRFGSWFDISPDGKTIAYHEKKEPGSPTHIYLKNIVTGAVSQFSDDKVGGLHPTWSPDGRSIAYVSQKKLRVKTIAGGAERILVDDPLLKELPTWSPDGQTIAYQGTANDFWGYEVFRVDVSTGQVTQLTKSKGLDVNPVFTADGQSLIFASDRLTPSSCPTLFVMKQDGSQVRQDMTAGCPVYLPNISLSAVLLDRPELKQVAADAPPAVEQPAPTAVAASATPEISTASPESETEISYSIHELIESLAAGQAKINEALDGSHIFYQVRTPAGILLQAKKPRNSEIIDIAAVPHSSLSRPDVQAGRIVLCFKFIDQSGQAMHIIQLRRDQPARTLAKLPLVPALAVENFDVSEDGSKIYFDVLVDEQFSIFRYDVASEAVEPVIPDLGPGMYPALSPDGLQLAYIGAGALRVLDLASGSQKSVTDGKLLKQYPVWSQDGAQVIYQASEQTETGFDIYVTDVPSSTTRAIVQAPGEDRTPAFLSNGQTIVFTSDRNSPGYGALYTVNGTDAQADVPEILDVVNVR